MVLSASVTHAEMPEGLDGWWIETTEYPYAELIERVEAAVDAAPMGIVFRASPNQAARQMLDIELPGNMVIGVFAPNYAARLMATYLPAQIEAPLRLYITANQDGTATLSYRLPSAVFAAYPQGGPELTAIAEELDQHLADIATAAVEH
jgi:uncharacterized protein (DUF302 family)